LSTRDFDYGRRFNGGIEVPPVFEHPRRHVVDDDLVDSGAFRQQRFRGVVFFGIGAVIESEMFI
jgi:hypothetical protein